MGVGRKPAGNPQESRRKPAEIPQESRRKPAGNPQETNPFHFKYLNLLLLLQT
jgi:hypothetical protein